MLRIALLSFALVAAPAFAKPATDWSNTVRATPSGGYVMGNPAAKVKLLEYGSLTCAHCARFEADAGPSLIADYVRGGRVSWEFRSFLLNAVDIPATLTASCAGPSRFFPLMRALYAGQRDWVGKVQAMSPERMSAVQAMSRSQQFAAIGDAAGFPAVAAKYGVPATRVRACLTSDAAVSRAVAVTKAGSDRLNVTGTPTFFVNGVKVDYSAGPSPWAVVKSKLDAALKTVK